MVSDDVYFPPTTVIVELFSPIKYLKDPTFYVAVVPFST